MVDFDVQMISHVIEVQTKPKTFGEEPIDGIMAVTNEGMTTYSKMDVQVGTLMQFHRYCLTCRTTLSSGMEIWHQIE